MDKLHDYVCQTDKLLANYVKIAEVDSGHILELGKSMENMRFMRNMNDQYTNKVENLMTHQIMTFWFKRQPKLIHDYSLVGYTLTTFSNNE